MNICEKIECFFKAENIEYYASIPIGECKILYERKLPKSTVSVCFFLIPYNISGEEAGNISRYAVPRDYHLYVKELSEKFKSLCPEEKEIYFFADNSPFDERYCAERAGLGEVGKNSLLLNSKYGSYVFIGSLLLPSSVSISHRDENYNSILCKNCEKCQKACPKVDACLSELNQKKKLTTEQEAELAKYPVRWGCDICQSVCPCNEGVADTPIEFFKSGRITNLAVSTLENMSDEEFSCRAYSWRGMEVIKRNVLM